MKSRTSFFNGTVFRKNLGRFTPLWGGYTICLLLGMFLMMDRNLEYWFAANLASMCSGMALVNAAYALLAAQLLFGDLYNNRMCNALHAMPLRRECWFTTHVFSGLFFSMLPTAIMAAVSEVFLVGNPTMENGWQIPLFFWLAANLEYLFFFSLAVFAAFCSGNRLGMAVIHVIINFASYLAFFLIDTLITPMYYGAVTSSEIFELLSPVAYLTNCPLIECERQKIPGTGEYALKGSFQLTENWLYPVVLAGLALVLLVVARQMYRRRKLECAGDVLATRKLNPVFMVVFSVTVGTVFQFVPDAMLGYDLTLPVFLFIGLMAGWFAGRMLLERQVNVFGKLKNWLGLVALAAAVMSLLYAFTLDPFGVVDYVPDGKDVKRVIMRNSYRGVLETEDPEEIADVITIHRGILEEKLTAEEANAGVQEAYNQVLDLPEVLSGQMSVDTAAERVGYRQFVTIDITYELKNGWKVNREYYLWADSEAAELARPYFSRLDAVFYHHDGIETAEDLMDLVRAPEHLYVDARSLPAEYLTADNVEDLFEAIIADCEAGTLTQTDGFHELPVVDKDREFRKSHRIELNLVEESLFFNVYADSEHCMQWLESTGILDFLSADDRPW